MQVLDLRDRRLQGVKRSPATADAASASIFGSTRLYVSSVMAIVECPNRSDTIFG